MFPLISLASRGWTLQLCSHCSVCEATRCLFPCAFLRSVFLYFSYLFTSFLCLISSSFFYLFLSFLLLFLYIFITLFHSLSPFVSSFHSLSLILFSHESFLSFLLLNLYVPFSLSLSVLTHCLFVLFLAFLPLLFCSSFCLYLVFLPRCLFFCSVSYLKLCRSDCSILLHLQLQMTIVRTLQPRLPWSEPRNTSFERILFKYIVTCLSNYRRD